MKVIGFHKPTEKYGFLSNWYKSDFTIDLTTFSSVEQYMMYFKAVFFCDKEQAAAILNTDNPAEIKRLGRMVVGYDDKKWSRVRKLIVTNAVYAKFAQNEELCKRLIATGDAILAECAVNDHIYGIGLSMNDPRRFDPKKWNGQNLLGEILMKVRDDMIVRMEA